MGLQAKTRAVHSILGCDLSSYRCGAFWFIDRFVIRKEIAALTFWLRANVRCFLTPLAGSPVIPKVDTLKVIVVMSA